jgi:hypothetical protein
LSRPQAHWALRLGRSRSQLCPQARIRSAVMSRLLRPAATQQPRVPSPYRDKGSGRVVRYAVHA